MNKFVRLTAGAVVAVALVTTSATAALASPVGSTSVQKTTVSDATCLARVQTHADHAIKVRLATLTRLEKQVTRSKRFTDAQKASYTAIIVQDRAGLTALQATIHADTTCAAAKADAAKIVTDYRVFKLLVKQIKYTKAIGRQNAEAAHLLTVAAALQTRIDAASAAGKNVATAQSDHDAMVAEIASAQAAINGLADQIAALTPAQVTKGSKPLAFARTALTSGHKHLLAARADARATAAALRAAA